MMKLEMGYFHIKDVVFGEESKLAGNIVTVDKRAVEKLVLEDKIWQPLPSTLPDPVKASG